MQIVINIPYGHYLSIKDGYLKDCIKATTEAIVNGTILPKGHGRIIDESQVTGIFTWDNGFIECFAPTIIEAADKEQEE